MKASDAATLLKLRGQSLYPFLSLLLHVPDSHFFEERGIPSSGVGDGSDTFYPVDERSRAFRAGFHMDSSLFSCGVILDCLESAEIAPSVSDSPKSAAFPNGPSWVDAGIFKINFWMGE